MRSTRLALAVALLLLLTGCGSDDAATSEERPEQTVSPGPSDSTVGPSPGEKQLTRRDGRDGSASKTKAGAPRHASRKGGRGSGAAGGGNDARGAVSVGTGSAQRAGEDGGASSGGSSKARPGSRRHAARARYPAAGTYVYSQSGYEQFCTTSCQRDALPPAQKVRSHYAQRSQRAALVIAEAHASRKRFIRTTTRYTTGGAFVEEVFLRFSFKGLSFSSTYHPRPPVEVLRWPLEVGSGWSGAWQGRVSGSHGVNVLARETIAAGGRTIKAFKLQASSTFRGEYEGSANVTLWVDPSTGTAIKTVGRVSVTSRLGRYKSAFQTQLQSGPG